MSPSDPPVDPKSGFSRRGFLKGAGLTVAAAGISTEAIHGATDNGERVLIHEIEPKDVVVQINGKKTSIKALPSTTLLEALRGDLSLTGAKLVCDRGACGACTVAVNGRTVNGCSTLVFDVAGKSIDTIEGLETDGKLTPLQQNFITYDATQCGFCTPGMLMSCTALLAENESPDREAIQDGISGNICRCGTYQNIFEAVEATAKGEAR